MAAEYQMWVQTEPGLKVPKCVFESCKDWACGEQALGVLLPRDRQFREGYQLFILEEQEDFAPTPLRTQQIKEVIQMTKEQLISELAEMAYMNQVTLDELAGELVLLELMQEAPAIVEEDKYYLRTRSAV